MTRTMMAQEIRASLVRMVDGMAGIGVLAGIGKTQAGETIIRPRTMDALRVVSPQTPPGVTVAMGTLQGMEPVLNLRQGVAVVAPGRVLAQTRSELPDLPMQRSFGIFRSSRHPQPSVRGKVTCPSSFRSVKITMWMSGTLVEPSF